MSVLLVVLKSPDRRQTDRQTAGPRVLGCVGGGGGGLVFGWAIFMHKFSVYAYDVMTPLFAIFFFLFDKDHDTVHCVPRATLNNKNISSWDLDPSAARDQDPSNMPRCCTVPPPSVSGAPVKLVSDYATRPLRLFGKVWSSSIVYTQFFFFFFIRLKRVRL